MVELIIIGNLYTVIFQKREFIMGTLLISILSGIILFLSFTFIIAVPSVIIITGYKKGVYWLILLNVLAAALGMLASGWQGGLYILLILLPFTYVIMYCMTQKIKFMRSVAAATFTFALMLIAVYMIIDRSAEGSLIDLITSYAETLAPQLQEYLAEFSYDVEINEIVDMAVEYVLMLVPSMLISVSFVVSLASYAVSAAYLNKKSDAKVPYLSFKYWDFPQQWGCFMLIALMLVYVFLSMDFAWAESLVVLLVVLYLLVMGIQGASFAYFFERQHKMPALPSLLIICIVLAVFPMLIVLLGFIDKLFRIRFTYMIRHGMIKMRKINLNVTDLNMNDFKNTNNGPEKFSDLIDDDEEHVDDADDDKKDDNDTNDNNDKNDDNENKDDE